jgi:hypothetical protein
VKLGAANLPRKANSATVRLSTVASFTWLICHPPRNNSCLNRRTAANRKVTGWGALRFISSPREGFQASCPLSLTGLTAQCLLLDDCDAWTLNASLTTLSSSRKCSKRRILGHSAQATYRLRIAGTMKSWPAALGFGCGSSTGFAADLTLKPGFGFRASTAIPLETHGRPTGFGRQIRVR